VRLELRLFQAGQGAALSLLLAACAAPVPKPEPMPPPTTVQFDGHWIVYQGDLTEDGNARARRLFSQHPEAQGLKITSNGGSITLGMSLGEWLLATGRDVYIDGYCFSSCANYVFPAGRRKIVSQHAVIGWHGGTQQWPSAQAMCDDQTADPVERSECLAVARAARQREERLYLLFRVDPEIMVFGLRPGANYPARSTDVAWTYSEEDLAHFGIRGFLVDGLEWAPDLAPDGQTVCLMDVRRGRCEAIEP